MKKVVGFLILITCLFSFQLRSQNNNSDSLTAPEIKKANSYTFFIPNAFSPDDNGINDIFIPVMMGIDESDYQFWIFDKQGNLIFNVFNDPSIGWNGKIKNSIDLMQNDVYVWKVLLKDKEGVRHSFIGTVNLIRL